MKKWLTGRNLFSDRTRPSINCEEPLKEVKAEPFQTYAKVSWKEPVAIDDTDGQIKQVFLKIRINYICWTRNTI